MTMSATTPRPGRSALRHLGAQADTQMAGKADPTARPARSRYKGNLAAAVSFPALKDSCIRVESPEQITSDTKP